jgi:hemolysin activation/secretion protein
MPMPYKNNQERQIQLNSRRFLSRTARHAPPVPRAASLLLLALALPSAAFAQQAAPRPEPLGAPAARAAPLPGLGLDAPTAPGPQLDLPTPFVVRAFSISGLTTISEAAVLATLSPWLGRTATAETLGEAAAAVTRYLRSQGLLVAQANLRQARDGVVEIAVLEGLIGAVRLEVPEEVRLRRSVAERFLEPLQAGDTLRRDNVEQSLLLLNDLPGIRIDASLASAQPAGTADVVVTARNDGDFASGTLTLDNAGLRTTGEYRADATLRLCSPLGLGDLLSVRAQSSHTGEQALASLTYGVAIDGLGTRLGVQVAEQHYRLGREFAALDANGEQRSASVLVSHPLLRRSDHNLIASASYTELRFDDRIDAFNFATETTQRLAGFALTADLRDGWLGGGSNAVQAQYIGGRASFASGGLSGNSEFSLARFSAQRTQAIGARSSLHLGVHGQLASQNVAAGSELAIGGPNAVRAYPVGELYADEGYVAQLEYRRSFDFFAAARTVLSVFFDDARVRVERNPSSGATNNKRSLQGYGLGFSQQMASNVMLQSSIAWRTTEAPTSDADRAPRAWVAVVTRF